MSRRRRAQVRCRFRGMTRERRQIVPVCLVRSDKELPGAPPPPPPAPVAAIGRALRGSVHGHDDARADSHRASQTASSASKAFLNR